MEFPHKISEYATAALTHATVKPYHRVAAFSDATLLCVRPFLLFLAKTPRAQRQDRIFFY
jgi:hypothetical protein